MLGAIEIQPLKLQWKSNDPVWTAQWPLPFEKLAALTKLTKQQLNQGRIEPSFSPWIYPVFVIKKKSGKWRMLIDLRNVNETMVTMGTLQPGLPNPSMIPKGWPVIILYLQDCFFILPLHPDDRQQFAFSISTTNNKQPVQRYHWKVLPQGMKYSPTICQFLVGQILLPIRERFPDAYIIHYMDDILLAASTTATVEALLEATTQQLQVRNLIVSEEKIQFKEPFNYLRYVMTKQTVKPQKMSVRLDNTRTLNDFQKLLGNINWLWPSLGIPNYALKNLFKTLEGPSDINSSLTLTLSAKQELKLVEERISKAFASRLQLGVPISLYIFATIDSPTAIIAQEEKPLEWVYLHTKQTK